MSAVATRATLDDLYTVEGKAELIDGRIVEIMASGVLPGSVALEIAYRLREYGKQTGKGRGFGDGVGFALSSPLVNGRESFCPDAAFKLGTRLTDPMRFAEGPPDFAVEVRSENDYGPSAEIELADKRLDYFQAGTQIVWDVDPVDEKITLYSSTNPTKGITFQRGDTAHAKPILPGWQLDVSQLFDDARS